MLEVLDFHGENGELSGDQLARAYGLVLQLIAMLDDLHKKAGVRR